jgi:hypothetical protein
MKNTHTHTHVEQGVVLYYEGAGLIDCTTLLHASKEEMSWFSSCRFISTLCSLWLPLPGPDKASCSDTSGSCTSLSLSLEKATFRFHSNSSSVQYDMVDDSSLKCSSERLRADRHSANTTAFSFSTPCSVSKDTTFAGSSLSCTQRFTNCVRAAFTLQNCSRERDFEKSEYLGPSLPHT